MQGQAGGDFHRGGVSRPSGWRKATAAVVLAEDLAAEGQGAAIEKGRAVVAVKRVGAHIGLKAADLLLIDTLSAFSPPQDWAEGQRPIVWASNAYLMAQTGFSLSTLKRHARRLAEAGVIAFKDSPNGKRWGHRDREGRIIEAYGFDLSPMAARAEEFEALAAQIAEERALCLKLKRQITIARRTIRARLEAMRDGQGAAALWSRFESLLARLKTRFSGPEALSELLSGFEALKAGVEAVDHSGKTETNSAQKTLNMTPKGVQNDPHIRITNQPDPVTCNSSENEEATGTVRDPEIAAPADPGLEEFVEDARATKGVAVDLAVVLQACPDFATWARDMGGFVKDWSGLHRIAGTLRPMIGISEQAWQQAQERLGPQAATAALVLTFDKHCTGEVTSPGGYLRGMVEKAGAGALHLERSFYGRLGDAAA